MTTITEDYVSFETAKLLKEKGFPLPSTNFEDWVFCMYDENGDIQWGCYHPDYYCRVTLQMAMKWLRIEHNIHIEPHIVKTKYSYGYMPNYINLKELKQHFPFDEVDFSNIDKYVYITYDKACEVSIKYCLENLI